MPGPGRSSEISPGAFPPATARDPAAHALAPGRRDLLLIGTIIVAAVMLGGGGQRYALANLAVQLTALGALALRPGALPGFWRNAPIALRTLVLLSLFLPLLQTIPLPQTVWSSAPGRELVSLSLEAVGYSGWMPLSVDPRRTLLALSALITPLAVLMIGWSCRRHHLVLLGWVVVALGLFNVLLGSVQVVSMGKTGHLYDTLLSGGILSGTFANRNSTGLFLVGALGVAALLPPPRPHRAVLLARLAVCSLLVVGILLTRSRTALVLTAIPVLLISLRALTWSPRGPKGGFPTRKLLVAGAIVAGLAAAAGALVALAPGRVSDTLERFETTGEDARFYIWEDGSYAASRYWPLGAGIGTFDEVFQVDESLENMTVRRAGRAHSDFLEVAIEAGLPGLSLVAGWIVLSAWLAWRARLSRLRWVAWANGAFLLAVALQSVTDYPLRNQALLAVAGFALLCLARIAFEPDGKRP